jgi:glycosyltransferase involved in cell wall biosynthesis
MLDRPEISIVIPLHNEAGVVQQTIDSLVRVLQSLETTWEIVVVDDGSTDETIRRIHEIAAREPNVVPMQLSRNFGKEGALAAGLEAASGNAVIVMDGDLQHPPGLIPELFHRWRAGADVVNAVKRTRGREHFSYKLAARVFYFLLGGAMRRQMESQSDFKLLDRQVVDQLRRFREQHRFFRGLVAWVGFRVEDVPFQVQERSGGRSSFTGVQLLRYAVRNLMSFSAVPLQAIAWLGFVTTGLAAILAMQTLYNWAAGRAISGFTTAIVVTLVMGGVNLFCLGIVAVYQSVMYDELKGRPGFILRKERHLTAPDAESGGSPRSHTE